MIRVQNLTKRYPRTLAVDNISFQVEKGEIVGFLGPNGAGKTTTMRVLTGFLPPTEGSAEVAGFNVVDKPLDAKRQIGYLPETPPLYPEMDVKEYLEYVGRLKGVPSSDLAARVDYSIGRCALGSVRNKLIGKLSKGYRQRVGLAHAIIHNPPVLILDEPTSGLDPKQIQETRDLIREFAGDHTIILSTHILSEVEHTCEKVIIINSGKLVATDSVSNLTSRLRGAEVFAVSVIPPTGDGVSAIKNQIESVPGVVQATGKLTPAGLASFQVESQPGASVRADVARAIVQSGYDLIELSGVAVSLEEVFLQLTAAEKAEVSGGAAR